MKGRELPEQIKLGVMSRPCWVPMTPLARWSAPSRKPRPWPNACYTDPAWQALEYDRLFARTWFVAGLHTGHPESR